MKIKKEDVENLLVKTQPYLCLVSGILYLETELKEHEKTETKLLIVYRNKEVTCKTCTYVYNVDELKDEVKKNVDDLIAAYEKRIGELKTKLSA